MKLYPLNDNKGYIQLISHMGTELDIVNDARVSYDNESDKLTEKDLKLIKYLLKHRHTSPLRGIVFKFEVKCPLFVARQWYKHHVASNFVDDQDGWNEVSYRYTQFDANDIYFVDIFRSQSTTNKQGSGEAVTDTEQQNAMELYYLAVKKSVDTYNKLVELDISKEQARAILPQCVYTRFRWTVSLHGLLHFLSLRDSADAQSEIVKYARAIKQLVEPKIPNVIRYIDKLS